MYRPEARTSSMASLNDRLLRVVAKTLEVTECSVTLVAVIDILLYAETLQCKHTTDTEQNLLLQTVLPVATVESVCDRAVELRVELMSVSSR